MEGSQETLSPKLAQDVVDKFCSAMLTLKGNIESQTSKFCEKVSKIWADGNAVTFASNHKTNMDSLINELSSNAQKFAKAIENAANHYTKFGNVGTITINMESAIFTGNTDTSQIKATFGEGSDEFGFKNPESGADQVLDSFDTYNATINAQVNGIIRTLNAINAFGNTEVKSEVAISAGKVAQIVRDSLAAAKKSIKKDIDATAKGYITTGLNAKTTTTFTVESGNGTGTDVNSDMVS